MYEEDIYGVTNVVRCRENRENAREIGKRGILSRVCDICICICIHLCIYIVYICICIYLCMYIYHKFDAISERAVRTRFSRDE